MFERLIQIFAGPHPLKAVGRQFAEMLELANGMVVQASASYWGAHLSPRERQLLHDRDLDVNRLQRSIRRELSERIASATTLADAHYGLLLMSLVKDVERLGDYAKDLAEVHSVTKRAAGDLPNGELAVRLRRVAEFVERLSGEVSHVYEASDQKRASELAVEGRRVSRECDEIFRHIASSSVSTAVAVDLTLATRYYKRISGHLLNLLSSVLMPLHQLDSLDEDEGAQEDGVALASGVEYSR